uniref:Tudor domain-containing protein n=1 Tax=Ditylenchus dipsaci TaxID=166011 RepID=A0A915CSZ0_9BILA
MNPGGSAFAKYDIYNDRDDEVPDLDDSALIKIYEETTAHLQSKVQEDAVPDGHQSVSSNKKGWKVGDQCMALFEDDGQFYPAKIIKILGDNACHVVQLLSENDMEMPAGLAQMTSHVKQKEVKAEAAHVPKLADFSIPSLVDLMADRLLPTASNDSNDALQSALVSWYMSGFHVGYLRAMQHLGGSSKPQEQ